MWIYLDTNKWIDFGRALNGRDDGKKFANVAKLIEEKTATDEWKLPLSIVHLMETLDISGTDRKHRFSELLIKYSKFYSLCTYRRIEKYEYSNALLRIVGKEEDVKSYLFKKSLYNMIDLSLEEIHVTAINDEIKEAVNELLVKHEHSEEDFLKIIDLQTYSNKNRLEWTQAAIESELERKKFMEDYGDDTTRYRYLVAPEYESKMKIYKSFIWNKIKEKKLISDEIEKIIDYIPSHFDEFLTSISSLHVRGKLMLQRYKDVAKPIHRNDIKDISFLSTALPYCDVVITENSWADYIRREKLDEKYSTKVFTDINDLLQLV